MRRGVEGRGIAACVAATALLFGARAGAHEFRPALLDVRAIGAGQFEVTWTPAPGGERVTPVFPASCARVGRDVAVEEAGADRRFVIDCGERGLAGQRVSVTGLSPLRDEVLLRLRLSDGAEVSAMLRAEQPVFHVPGPAGEGEVPRASGARGALVAYGLTGATHLFTGPDHMLFLIGLLLLVARARGEDGVSGARGGVGRRLFFAITAFTVAHSVSLAMQVTGVVRLAPGPVEAAIALSVLLVARELLRSGEDDTLLARRPALVTFAFGLLHGLGFAGGLSALRVPQGEIPLALLGFNLGLEAAQLSLVMVCLGAARGGRRLRPLGARLPVWARRAPAYALGTVAAFWLFSRAVAM